MSERDINPVIDILVDKIRYDKKASDEDVLFEAGLALLRIALLNIDRIADALEMIAFDQQQRMQKDVFT